MNPLYLINMDELEELRRIARDQKNHIDSLSDALRKAVSKATLADAQIKSAVDAGYERLKEAVDLIDRLHDRIEIMVDEWQAQIRNNFKGNESEKAKLLETVEPFRPVRIGEQKTV